MEIISQYGVETASPRPQGKNPADDFFSIAKSAAVAQTRLEINPYGAEAKILLDCYNCYRLWRIELTQSHRPNITKRLFYAPMVG